MIKKYLMSLFILSAFTANLFAVDLPECEVRGVRPSDKISTLELNPSITTLDNHGGSSISNMTVKYYYSFGEGTYSIGTELPFSRFESPAVSKNGIGDILLSASVVKRFGNSAIGAVTEFTLPSATYDELGIGKWQISPAVYGEIEPIENVFMALGYKHYVSVAGPSSRNDINLGRIRFITAYLSEYNWWVMLDPKYYIDFEDNSAGEFIFEIETGIMLYDEISMYLKPGWHVAGNRDTMDWSLSFGVKLLSI